MNTRSPHANLLSHPCKQQQHSNRVHHGPPGSSSSACSAAAVHHGKALSSRACGTPQHRLVPDVSSLFHAGARGSGRAEPAGGFMSSNVFWLRHADRCWLPCMEWDAAGAVLLLLPHAAHQTAWFLPCRLQDCSAGDSAAYQRRNTSLDDVVIVSALRTPLTKVGHTWLQS